MLRAIAINNVCTAIKARIAVVGPCVCVNEPN